MTHHKDNWEEEFYKKIHGWHGSRDEIIQPDEFFYSIEGIKYFIRETRTAAHDEGVREALGVVKKMESNNEHLNVFDSTLDEVTQALTALLQVKDGEKKPMIVASRVNMGDITVRKYPSGEIIGSRPVCPVEGCENMREKKGNRNTGIKWRGTCRQHREKRMNKSSPTIT